MSAPTAIPVSHTPQPFPQHHARQPSFGAASAYANAPSPHISSLGSAAFSFPRTAGSGVTTGPLHSPTQARIFANSSPPKAHTSASSATSAAPVSSYFDDAVPPVSPVSASTSASSTAGFGTHSRAKSASVSSAFSASSSSTLASSDGPRTPRLSTSSTLNDRVTVVSPSSAAAAAAAATATGPTTTSSSICPPPMGRVPSLALGSTTYDAAKSRVISQPWVPTLGSKWTAALSPSASAGGVPFASTTTNHNNGTANPASFTARQGDDATSSDMPSTTAGAPGRLGTLFRKLSLSTSPNLPQLAPGQPSPPGPGTAAGHHYHHHRHHSMSIPASYQRPAAPTMSAEPKSTMGSAFGPGGSTIPTDDLLPSAPAMGSAPSTAATRAATNTPPPPHHPIARSEPSSSPVMPSHPLGSEPRGRKASVSAGAGRKRRPSPTGERLLSMGHFGHH